MLNQQKPKIINNFSITISTVNGSGSATANNTILKSIFKMGIPVSGRNVFPSNIQGLPTWYSIRVSEQGYFGRLEQDDILILMNPDTVQNDLSNLAPGGVVLINDQYNNDLQGATTYPMPVEDLLKQTQAPTNLRLYLANMVYVGIISYLLGIDLEKIRETLTQHFGGKESAVDANMRVVNISYQWASESLTKSDPFCLEKSQKTNGYIMADGNSAAAIGALYGGLQFAAWYPITPATSLAESLNEYIPTLRTDPQTGQTNCVVVQAEDELAAIGMCVGAGWAGLRAMTSTSGPGICLMSEYLGLAYQSEVPLVVWDVQRTGPSTGLPTRTSQGDLSFSYFLSHGDTDYVILLPGSVHECFEFAWCALDIAEQLQTPVIVLSDLYLGMNLWMTKAFKYPGVEMQRGKILWENDLEMLLQKRHGDWGRYLDIDGDGIPYRTVPGNTHPKAPYFARGTGHDAYARYSENPINWQKEHQRLKQKFEFAKKITPEPVLERENNGKIGLISYGSSHFAAEEAVDLIASEMNTDVDYLRIRAIPFHQSVQEFIAQHDRTYVVEVNRDGQMAQLLIMNYPQLANKINKMAHLDGVTLSARWIVDAFSARENSNE